MLLDQTYKLISLVRVQNSQTQYFIPHIDQSIDWLIDWLRGWNRISSCHVSFELLRPSGSARIIGIEYQSLRTGLLRPLRYKEVPVVSWGSHGLIPEIPGPVLLFYFYWLFFFYRDLSFIKSFSVAELCRQLK